MGFCLVLFYVAVVVVLNGDAVAFVVDILLSMLIILFLLPILSLGILSFLPVKIASSVDSWIRYPCLTL